MRSWQQSATSSAMPNFACVDVYTSCILKADLSSAWQAVRQWCSAPWLTGDGELTLRAFRVENEAGNEVGSTRLLRVGIAQMFEQLTAVDDEETMLRWKLISHPETISPFRAASYINASSTLRLRPITVGGNAFVEWSVRFFTEPQHTQQLHATLQGWSLTGFKNLQVYLDAQLRGRVQLAPYAAGQQIGLVSTSKAKPRFVGTMPEDFGVPFVSNDPFLTRTASTGHTQVQADLGDAPTRESSAFTAAARAKAAAALLRSQSQTRIGRHTSRAHKDPLPQGPGPPPSLASARKMSIGSQVVHANYSGGSSNSQSVDSRSSSYGSGEGARANKTPGRKKGGAASDFRWNNSSAMPTEGQTDSAPSMAATSGSSQRSDSLSLPEELGGTELTTQKLEAHARDVDAALAPASNASGITQSDGMYMDQLGQRLEASWAERGTARSSFEEAAHRLEMRQRQLHRAPAERQDQSPFASPFASPFTTPNEASPSRQQQSRHAHTAGAGTKQQQQHVPVRRQRMPTHESPIAGGTLHHWG